MVFVDETYISIARKTEATFHAKKVEQLERSIKELTNALAWEHQQHRSRLQELDNVAHHANPSRTQQGLPHHSPATLQPIPGTTRSWRHARRAQRQHLKNGQTLTV